MLVRLDFDANKPSQNTDFPSPKDVAKAVQDNILASFGTASAGAAVELHGMFTHIIGCGLMNPWWWRDGGVG